MGMGRRGGRVGRGGVQVVMRQMIDDVEVHDEGGFYDGYGMA